MKKFLATLATAMILSNSTFAAEGMTLTLDEAIELALKNNRLIEQSEEDRESARWNLSAVRRNSGLNFSWSSSLNRIGGRYYNSYREQHDRYKNTKHAKQFPSYFNENTNSVHISMPLYSGGQLENQRESARYALNSADLTLENSRQEVKCQAASAYYNVLQQKSLVGVQEQAVEVLQEHLRHVTVQYEIGTIAKSDVLSTSVQLANSQQSLTTAQGNYRTAVAQLNNVLGLPVDTEIAASSPMNFVKYDVTEEQCLEYALNHRPDGIAALYAVKSAQADTASAKSGYRPKVNAVINGNMSGEGVFKADHSDELWMVGLELNWNIFDNGVTSAQVQRSKSAERKAESIAHQQIETIQLEVHNAYINLKTAEKNIEITTAAVGKAEEEFAIAQVRYTEGVDTNLNVMDAQEKVVETRNNYYTALYNYNTSRTELEKAMGVPIVIDALLYSEAQQAGKSEKKTLEAATITRNDHNTTTEPITDPF